MSRFDAQWECSDEQSRALSLDKIDWDYRKECEGQFFDPQHCFLLIDGEYFRHRLGDLDNPLRGTPIRLTKMAAERIAKQFRECPLSFETTIVPCVSIFGQSVEVQP